MCKDVYLSFLRLIMLRISIAFDIAMLTAERASVARVSPFIDIPP